MDVRLFLKDVCHFEAQSVCMADVWCFSCGSLSHVVLRDESSIRAGHENIVEDSCSDPLLAVMISCAEAMFPALDGALVRAIYMEAL